MHTKHDDQLPHIQVSKTVPHPFKPDCEIAACYLEIDGRLLLLKRAQGKFEGEKWGVPAGKIEKGETPVDAAMRELSEETGIQVFSTNVKEMGKLYIRKGTGAYIFYLFQIAIDTTPQVVLNAEHTEYKWASDQEIALLQLIGGGKEALSYYKELKVGS